MLQLGAIEPATLELLKQLMNLPELKDFLEEAELELLACREWITGKTPGIDTWSVFLLAQRKE